MRNLDNKPCTTWSSSSSSSTLSLSSTSLSKTMDPFSSIYGCEGCHQIIEMEGLMNSPLGLLAPTMENMAQVMNISCTEDSRICSNGFASETLCGVQEKFNIPQEKKVAVYGWKDEINKPEESLINPSLLFELSELKACDYSAFFPVTKDLEESDDQEKVNEGNTRFGYSNVSDNIQKEDGRKLGGSIGELGKGFSKISPKEKRMTEFVRKHTRFIYCSNNETEEEKEGDEEEEDDGYDHDDDYYEDDDAVREDGGVFCKLYKRSEFMGKRIRFIYDSDDEVVGVC